MSNYLVYNDKVAFHPGYYVQELVDGGTFLLNSHYSNDEVFSKLTRDMQETIISKKIKFYNINAEAIIRSQPGLRGKGANTVMMVAYFKVSGIVPFEQAEEGMKEMTRKTFKKKGDDVVNMNLALIDAAINACQPVEIPASLDGVPHAEPVKFLPDHASEFAKAIIEPSMKQQGDSIPVSAMSVDGKIPTGTSCLEKRGIAPRVPTWNAANCIQCNVCSLSCPHAAIRANRSLRRISRVLRPASRRPNPKRKTIAISSSRFRSTSKTAPAAASAWMSAR